MISTISKLIGFLDSPSRVQIGLLLVPMFFVGLLEMASIGLIIPVIQAILPGHKNQWLTEIFQTFAPEASAANIAILVSAAFAATFVIKNVLLLAMTYVINHVVMFKTADFMQYMYKLYLGRPLLFHLQRNSAELLRNLMTGAAQSYEALRLVLVMLLDILMMVAAFLLLVIVEPYITAAIVLTLGLFASLFYYASSPIFRRWGEEVMVLDGKLMKLINESYSGIRDVKLHEAYDFLNDRFGAFARARSRILSLSSTSIYAPRLFIETVIVIAFLSVTLLLVGKAENTNELVATLGVFGMAALRIMPTLNRVLTNAAELKHRMAYIDELNEDFRAGHEDTEFHPDTTRGSNIEFRQGITFEHVSYRYPGIKRPALNRIDLEIQRGQSIGIVGPSGAGKSTFIDVTLGLLRPQTGRILVDSRDVFSDIVSWRRCIGFVPQQVHILDDTVRRNIAFGLPDDQIDEARIDATLEMARLRDVVAELPDGLDTVLGETGTRLSGGQRQRIAIARALYRDPQLLIFDEATSALDNETEYEIGRAINSLAGSKTVVAIAHRLTTVRNCDKLIFLIDGNVSGVGTYDELVHSNETFRRFAEGANDAGNTMPIASER